MGGRHVPHGAAPAARAVSLLRHRITQLEGQRANAKSLLAEGPDWGKPEHVAEVYRLWLACIDTTIGWTEDLVQRIEAGEYTMADDGPDHFGACR